MPSRRRPSVVPESVPVAPGQWGTKGTGTLIAPLFAAVPVPPALAAVAPHVSLEPSSSFWTLYVALVAPWIGVPPRLHWYVYVEGEPVHPPCAHDRVLPAFGVPVIGGAVVSWGAGGSATVTASPQLLATPSLFESPL